RRLGWLSRLLCTLLWQRCRAHADDHSSVQEDEGTIQKIEALNRAPKKMDELSLRASDNSGCTKLSARAPIVNKRGDFANAKTIQIIDGRRCTGGCERRDRAL